MSQAASNTHAVLACKALGMLSGSMMNDLETPKNPLLVTALKRMLTRPLAKLLRNRRAGGEEEQPETTLAKRAKL